MHMQLTKKSDPKNDYSQAASAATGLGLQRKLTVGAVNDPMEEEADAMADRVMRMPDKPLLQRKCAECEEEEKVQRKPLAASITPFIQTKAAEGDTASDAVTSQINASKGGGSSLDNHTKSFMEGRFGVDFSDVKIHTDGEAVQLNRDLNAQAFTVGNDIYFNSGKFAPNTENGKHLLAHELTHTVQQQGSSMQQISRLKITPTKSFTQGPCGERSVYWNFESGVKAPKGGGYIIQQINNLENIKDCPAEDVDFIPITPTFTFYEAWWVAEGDTIQEKHKLGIVDFTDRSARPASLGNNKSGIQVSLGQVRFFSKNTTGDLGKEDQLSRDPTIAADWKPGTKGGVPQSGWLPSTMNKPSWWGSSLDGPTQRWANSWWNCCGEKSKHKSESDASPK